MKNIIIIISILAISLLTSCVKTDFDEPEEYPFSEYFKEDINAFTIYDVKGDATWKHGTHNEDTYAEISGFQAGANEDWLISPAIDLSKESRYLLSFTHGVGYLKDWDAMTVWVSGDYDGKSNPNEQGTWTEFADFYQPVPSGKFSYIEDSGDFDISEFAGNRNFYVAFKYTSTEHASSTWEIGSVKIKNKNK